MHSKNIRSGNKITLSEFIAGILIFIIAGSGFIVMHINSIDVIDKSDAKEITASFESFDYSSSRSGYIHYIDLVFSDAETMRIDSSLASWGLIDLIKEIDKGTQLHMLVDESRNYVVELKTDDNVFICFEDAQYNMKSDKTGLAVLGIIMIAGGAFLLLYIGRKKRKGLRGQNEINDMINPV